MARIRSVKIGFFRNEDLCAFGFAHRLLFEGLWLLADKAGRLEDRPKRIHADLFPFDASLDIGAMLTELADGLEPFVTRYSVNGRRYLQVLNFTKHQRPHHTEPDSEIPGPENADHLNPPEPHGEQPADNGSTPLGNGKGREWVREGNGKRGAPSTTPEELRDAWNAGTSKPLPQCKELTDNRRRAARSRLKERPLADWLVVIGKINASSFCRGKNDWVATFDWLLKPDTAVKVLEGKYDDKHVRGPTKPLKDWYSECKDIHDGACPDRSQHELRLFKEQDVVGL